MKQLRRTIRKLLIENKNNKRYENLFNLLDSYDLDVVEEGIELLLGMELGQVTSHTARRGGPSGFKGVQRVFELELSQEFMEYVNKVFEANRGMSPKRNIHQGDGPLRSIQIFAEDTGETWSDVCDDRFEKSVDMPI